MVAFILSGSLEISLLRLGEGDPVASELTDGPSTLGQSLWEDCFAQGRRSRALSRIEFPRDSAERTPVLSKRAEAWLPPTTTAGNT